MIRIFITPECGYVVISVFGNTEVLFYKYTKISFLAIPQSPSCKHTYVRTVHIGFVKGVLS